MGSNNDNRLVLFDYPGSPCARRVKVSMIEKGLQWKNVTVDLSRMEQRHPEYLAINPNGKVPALIHGNRVIVESNDITRYLDKAFANKPMYPTDKNELAQVKCWQQAELDMAKDYRPLMYQRLMGPMLRLTLTLDEALARARLSTTNPKDLEWERKVWSLEVASAEEQVELVNKLMAWLDNVEVALEGKQYLVGNRFGQAEISLYPRISMYPWIGLTVNRFRYPNVVKWMKRLAKRECFKATLAPKDRGIQQLSRTPLFPFLADTLPDRGAQSFKTRLILAGLQKLVGVAMASQFGDKKTLPEKLRPLTDPGELVSVSGDKR